MRGTGLVWVSNSVFEDFGTAMLLNVLTSRLDSVWFKGVRKFGLVVVGDSALVRNSGPARSLVGAVLNNVRYDFGAEGASGADFIYAAASIQGMHMAPFDRQLGAGLRFTDSVAQISNLESIAPLAPAVATGDSVVWIHDSQLRNASTAVLS